MQESTPNPPAAMTQTPAVLVRDLLLGSRVTAVAKSQGQEVRLIRSPDGLATHDGTLLMVDLNQSGFLEAAVSWRDQKADVRRIVGFVAHEDIETIQRAKSLGFDQILTKGRFVQCVGELLR